MPIVLLARPGFPPKGSNTKSFVALESFLASYAMNFVRSPDTRQITRSRVQRIYKSFDRFASSDCDGIHSERSVQIDEVAFLYCLLLV